MGRPRPLRQIEAIAKVVQGEPNKPQRPFSSPTAVDTRLSYLVFSWSRICRRRSTITTVRRTTDQFNNCAG